MIAPSSKHPSGAERLGRATGPRLWHSSIVPIIGRPLPPRWQSERFVVVDEDGKVVGYARQVYGLEEGSSDLSFSSDRVLRAWFESWANPPGVRSFFVRDNKADCQYAIHGAFHHKSTLLGDLTAQGVHLIENPTWWPPEDE